MSGGLGYYWTQKWSAWRIWQRWGDADIFALVNLAGAGIMDKRWTHSRQQQIRESRLQTTNKVLDWCRKRGRFPPVVISGSAIGYYGDTGERTVDENTGPGESFAPRLCCDWELVAGDFARAGSRLCLLRTGIVLGPDGGALASMLPAFKYGLGGRLGSGEQWMSWIHREDLLRLVIWLLVDGGTCGPVNATAPAPVRNREFTRALAQALGRPAFLPVPAFVLKLVLGQAAEELLLASNRVIPAKAQSAGFSFHYPDINAALEACVKKFEIFLRGS